MPRKIPSSFSRLFGKYLFEVIAIFIGISISFLFDEWRDARKDRQTERKHLENLRSSLAQDTLLLGIYGLQGKSLMNSTLKLATFKDPAEVAGNLNNYIDSTASYIFVTPNQVAYEELKQTGQFSLIRNDTLKRAILAHYTIICPAYVEWCTIDKTHTMTQLIPEMNQYFPAVADPLNLVATERKIAALRTIRLRNLLLTGYTYKQATLQFLEIGNNNTKALIRLIDKELRKE